MLIYHLFGKWDLMNFKFISDCPVFIVLLCETFKSITANNDEVSSIIVINGNCMHVQAFHLHL